MVKKTVLKNGICVLSEALPHLRSCAVGIWAVTGSRHESAELSGISHFIEHMLFKGTPTMDAPALACAFDEIGGQVNAFTSKDHTCYYTRTTDEHLLRAAELLIDMYLNSVFDKKETDLERGVICEEIDMYEDTPDDLVNEILCRAIYRNDPLGMPVLGSKETLAGITPEILRRYHKEHYDAGHTVVSLCGSISDEALAALCEKLEAIPAGKKPAADGKAEYTPSVVLRRKKIEQNHLSLAFNGVPLGDPDRFVMQALCNILGAGMSSRLFQRVREQNGLCYSIYSFCANYIGAGTLSIYVGLSRESQGKALELIRKILDEAKAGEITADELARTQEQLKTSLLMGMESTISRMSTLARNEMVYGRDVSEYELIAGINAVTLDDITRLSNRVFDYKTLSFSAVGNVAAKSEYMDILRA